MIMPIYRWRLPEPVSVDPECRDLAHERGISDRLLTILAGRGIGDAASLAAFLAPAMDALHDPRLLPDAERALRRVALARERGERILVYGDFDADGLSGLVILVLALRRLGLDAQPYVPERLADGHGLSLRAVDLAADEGRTLIVTVDCGTSSSPEIELAAGRGIDVVVTDHHHAATWPDAAVAVVNPQRADSLYPDHHLTGSGVAWKFASLLLEELGAGGHGPTADVGVALGPGSFAPGVEELADLALLGTVADVAPILGENRAIAQLGLGVMRHHPRPGLAALLERAGVACARLDLEDIGFAIAPRLNAAGRVGEAARAAQLLLADDRAQADALAAEIEQANLDRREMTRLALAEARRTLGLEPVVAAGMARGAGGAGSAGAVVNDDGSMANDSGAAAGRDGLAAGSGTAGQSVAAVDAPSGAPLPAALLVVGDWSVGIIGLIAGRLAEDLGRPAVVATLADPDAGILRASCRSPEGFNLAEALIACADLLVRHGGHAAAAGFDIAADRWPEFAARFLSLAGGRVAADGPAALAVDLVLQADALDYAFVREIDLLAPTGTGNPAPNVMVTGLRVVRVRATSGGHTQLVLGRNRDVIDAVAFRRPDLPALLHEGDRIDIVARAASRQFGGYESIQLQVIDVAAEGTQLPQA